MTASRIIQFTPLDVHFGERIDKVLGSVPEIGSRSRAEDLLSQGRVKLRGKSLRSSYRLQKSDQIEIDLPEKEVASDLKSLDLDLDVVFEDEYLMVINKPAGLVVHPAAGHHDDTLVNALVGKADWSMKFGEIRPGIVHRLDKDTSGLLVIAKDDQTQSQLVEQFKERKIIRQYQAVIWSAEVLPSQFTVQSFLARHPTQRKKFASVRDRAKRIIREKNSEPARGKWAVTHVRIVKRNKNGLALLDLKLETGRTHQIRVHLAEAGAAILADPIYGRLPASYNSLGKECRSLLASLPRLCLHAMELGFCHPRTGENLLFHADWPTDLAPLLEQLELL